MSRWRFVDIREAESTTLRDGLDRYLSGVTVGKKGAKQEEVRIKKWKESKYADKSLAAIRSSDMAAYRDAELAGCIRTCSSVRHRTIPKRRRQPSRPTAST